MSTYGIYGNYGGMSGLELPNALLGYEGFQTPAYPGAKPQYYNPGGQSSVTPEYDAASQSSINPETLSRESTTPEYSVPSPPAIIDGTGSNEVGGAVSNMEAPQAPAFGPYNSGGNMMNPNYNSMPPQAPLGGGMANSAGNLLSKGGDAAIMSGNPYAMAAGAGAKVLGEGVKLYGAYQAEQQARKNYEMMLEEWRKQKAEAARDKQRELERQRRQEGYYAGKYSSALQHDLAQNSLGYKQR